MKAGNATPGNWEPWVERQDTHSSLKRQVDKGKGEPVGDGKWRDSWVLKIHYVEREGKKCSKKTESRARRWLHRRWEREEDIPLIRLPEQRLKEMKNKEGTLSMALHTCSHLSKTTSYKLLPDASLKIRWSAFIKKTDHHLVPLISLIHTRHARSTIAISWKTITLDLGPIV